jgi:hypothetical protein
MCPRSGLPHDDACILSGSMTAHVLRMLCQVAEKHGHQTATRRCAWSGPDADLRQPLGAVDAATNGVG